MSDVAATATGAVYDRGYRPYDGVRGGRAAARRALWKASVRRALGIRRSWRQKIAPAVLLGLAIIPAIVNVGVAFVTRNMVVTDFSFITYREYVGVSNLLLVFVAVSAPDMMCPDRRQHVLPLVFSRPITGVDYVMAKFGAMAAILFAFSFLPQVVLFVGQMLVSPDGALDYLTDTAEVLWQVPVAVAVLAVYYAVIGTAIASLTGRRITAGASIVGFFLVTSILSAAFTGDPTRFGYEGSWAALLDLLSLPLVLRDLVFLGEVDRDFALSGVEGGGAAAVAVYVAVVLASFALLLWRYREVER